MGGRIGALCKVRRTAKPWPSNQNGLAADSHLASVRGWNQVDSGSRHKLRIFRLPLPACSAIPRGCGEPEAARDTPARPMDENTPVTASRANCRARFPPAHPARRTRAGTAGRITLSSVSFSRVCCASSMFGSVKRPRRRRWVAKRFLLKGHTSSLHCRGRTSRLAFSRRTRRMSKPASSLSPE